MSANLEKLAGDYINVGLKVQGETLQKLAESWKGSIPEELPIDESPTETSAPTTEYLIGLTKEVAESDVLRQYRLLILLNLEKTGINQRSLARRLNIAAASLSRTLSGRRNPSGEILLGIGRIFDVPLRIISDLSQRLGK